jgi:plasmid maintenance system killer protein
MKVFFRSNKLQKTCNTEKAMLVQMGEKRTRKLKQRLMELQAADNLQQIPKVPPPRCHELSGDRKGQLSVDLDHPYRLIFIPADDPVPTKNDGGLDWTRVTAVEILEIADTH